MGLTDKKCEVKKKTQWIEERSKFKGDQASEIPPPYSFALEENSVTTDLTMGSVS